MKTVKLFLMVLLPVFIGYLYINLVYIPFLFYAVPILMTVYWFWSGTEFADSVKSSIKAIVLANSAGILSLILFYWQFVIAAKEERNFILAVFSQLFTAPLSFIAARIVVIFQQTPNDTTKLITQVTALIYMMMVFSGGYYFKKKHSKQDNN